MAAAIVAARSGADVTIIEKNSVLGKKLSMTGNGRCNITNTNISEECYNPSAGKLIRDILSVCPVSEVLDFFKSLGVVVTDEDGYIYPRSGQAMTVVNALKDEINRLGIKVIYDTQVKRILPDENSNCRFLVKTNKEPVSADAVILALGSLSGPGSTMSTGDGYYICKELGMSIKDTYPALVGFKCNENEYLPEHGVRADAGISFMLGGEVITSERGELQITKDGISGIPVMQASRDIVKLVSEKKPVFAVIDFFADYDANSFLRLKEDILKLRDNRTLSEFLQGFANSNVTDMILRRMKLSGSMKMKNISESMAECILDNYRVLKLGLSETYGYAASQVTTGGVSLGDISSDMSYINNKNIFVTGELTDVDGRCGGYNLQYAFSSGIIAGRAASV